MICVLYPNQKTFLSMFYVDNPLSPDGSNHYYVCESKSRSNAFMTNTGNPIKSKLFFSVFLLFFFSVINSFFFFLAISCTLNDFPLKATVSVFAQSLLLYSSRLIQVPCGPLMQVLWLMCAARLNSCTHAKWKNFASVLWKVCRTGLWLVVVGNADIAKRRPAFIPADGPNAPVTL